MISKGWVTWGWGVFCHHCVSVGSGQASHTWDNLEYLPSGPDSLFLPPWEWLSCAWLPEVLVPNLHKEMDQLLRASSPSLVFWFHAALLPAGCEKGTPSRASLGSVALHAHIWWLFFSTVMSVSVPRPSSDPEKEVASCWEWMTTILLWLGLPQEDISCHWGPHRVLSSKLVERSFIISFIFLFKVALYCLFT